MFSLTPAHLVAHQRSYQKHSSSRSLLHARPEQVCEKEEEEDEDEEEEEEDKEEDEDDEDDALHHHLMHAAS